jgi:hypothetical protein
MKCAGCNRKIEVGDRFIRDTPSGFLKKDDDLGIDDILSTLLGGDGTDIFYCEDCTQPGGFYTIETYYGDEEEGDDE